MKPPPYGDGAYAAWVPRIVASCSTGYADTSEQCPEAGDDAKTKAVGHCNTNPHRSDELPTPHANGLWKYDPDFDSSLVARPWAHECLFASAFPLPEVSRPDSPQRK
jgi:hypothetical protein